MTFHLNPWYWITLLGTPELWVGVAAGVAIFYLVHLRSRNKKLFRPFFIVFVISLMIAFVAVIIIKDVTAIERPCGIENHYCESGFSFPSGHAAAAFAGFTSLILFLSRKWLFLIIVPILVALSRVMLGVHTATDVFAGTALGVAIPIVVKEVVKRRLKGREK